MSKISTIQLDLDVRHAGVQHGTISRSELDAAAIIAMLENFQSIDAMEMLDVDPQIIAMGRECTLIIRSNRKKLFVYNAKNMNEAAVEMTPIEIVQKLDNIKLAPMAEETKQSGLAAAPPPSHTGIGYALLGIAFIINVYTLYSMFSKPEEVDDKSDVIYISDANEIAQNQQLVAGTYATGREKGDRILIINSDGTLQYSEIGASGNPSPWTGTYHVGSRNHNLCLSVDGGSIIGIIDHDIILYYGDTYARSKQD